MVQVQETKNQIITHYDVFDQRPSDRDLLLGAVETHQRVLGRVPHLATADAGYYSRAQERFRKAFFSNLPDSENEARQPRFPCSCFCCPADGPAA